MGKIIGIDLGTTNSVVSVMEGGDPIVIPTAEGSHLCPSVVAFNKNGERLIGFPAKRQAVVNPDNTVYSIKRFMGRRYNEVEQERKIVSYTVIPSWSGDARVDIPSKKRVYTPQEISAMILAKLKTDAEAYLGEPVTQAVITVPAYFNDSQRQATKDAGKIAGLDVLRIINEPTASALAYGLDSKKDEKILVFDLGGGTFDVSILEVGEGIFEVKATSGDTHLGGDDWDEIIVQWAVENFSKEQGLDLRKDRQALQRLREAAEKAKIELSNVMETEINLPYITADISGPKHLQMRLSRSRFEEMSAKLVEQLKRPFNAVLKDTGLTLPEIDEIVLVGGATRMPVVQRLVQQLTGKEPNKSVNPDEVVSVGAAIQAGVLSGEVQDVLLLDVTPLSLGLETIGGVMTPLIERNTTIPVRKSQIFSTAEDNQSAVDIHVLQGERPMAADNVSMGRFRLDGIPLALRGMPQIEVTFDIDANGILHVVARDQVTQREQKVTITASTNLTLQDIDRLIQEAEQHRTEDEQRRKLVEVKNLADTAIYQAEKMFQERSIKTSSTLWSEVGDKIEDVKKWMEGNDLSGLRDQIEKLNQLVSRVTQETVRIDSNDSDEEKSDPSKGDTVEGEFQKF